MLPNFIVIGAAKCGTTSFCSTLSSHPDIFFSDPKEPRYFSSIDYDGSEECQENYEKLFESVSGERMVGEGTTTYTHPEISSVVAERIACTIPKCKLIFLVRHPIRRIESDWRMRCFEGWAPDDINDAVEESPSLIAHSLYLQNLSPYLKIFPEDQIQVVFLEDFSENPTTILQNCFTFLGVDPTLFVMTNERKRRNDSRNFRKDRYLALLLRRSQKLARLRDLLPNRLVKSIKVFLTTKSPYIPAWKPECLQYVHDQLRKDSSAFLKLWGKPTNFWIF